VFLSTAKFAEMRYRLLMRATLLIVVLSAGSATRASDDVISFIHMGLPHDALYDVSFNGQKGIAVGANGAVLSSDNGGQNWKPNEPTSELALLALATIDDRLLVAGQQGLILAGRDVTDLSVVESPTTERLMSIALHDSGLAVAVGGFGTVLVSTDAGASWEVPTSTGKRCTRTGWKLTYMTYLSARPGSS